MVTAADARREAAWRRKTLSRGSRQCEMVEGAVGFQWVLGGIQGVSGCNVEYSGGGWGPNEGLRPGVFRGYSEGIRGVFGCNLGYSAFCVNFSLTFLCDLAGTKRPRVSPL